MANLYGLDAVGNAAYVKATGTGTNVDPYLVQNDLFNPALKSAILTGSAGADVITAVGGAKLRVLALAITASSACTVKLQRAGTTDITPPLHIAANGSVTLSNPLGLFESGVGEKINAVLSGAATYSVLLTYREVLA
jgi:hypothetical protein